jgi:hypothetical protein
MVGTTRANFCFVFSWLCPVNNFPSKKKKKKKKRIWLLPKLKNTIVTALVFCWRRGILYPGLLGYLGKLEAPDDVHAVK